MSRQAFVVLACAGSWLGFGCAFDETPAGTAVCVEGQKAECACDGDSRGLHGCSAGEYGPCVCGPASSTGAGEPASSAGDDVSGTGSGASTGSGGAGTGAAAGGGGTATAGAGGGGSSGGGGAGRGGSGAAGTSGSGAAGAAGSAGSAGMGTGDAGKGGDGEPPVEPGTHYGFCAAQGECKDGLICYTVTVDGMASGYCAPGCTIIGGAGGNGGGGLGSCEQPTTGNVQAQCAPLVTLCLLGTCANKDCPAGMKCVETALPFGQQGGVFDCRYPVP